MAFIPEIRCRYSHTNFNIVLSGIVLTLVTLGSFSYFIAENSQGTETIFQIVKQQSYLSPSFFAYDFSLRHWIYYCGLLAFYLASFTPLIIKPTRFSTMFEEIGEEDSIKKAMEPSSILTATLCLGAVFILPWFFIHSDLMFETKRPRGGAMAVWGLWWILTIWFFAVVNVGSSFILDRMQKKKI